MDTMCLTGAELANFFIGGSAYLSANKEQINALNVFPVPDGDTGKMCIRDRSDMVLPA